MSSAPYRELHDVSFAKLWHDGCDLGWGVRAPLNSLGHGDRVAVRKANGETKVVTIAGKAYDDRGAFMRSGPKGASYYTLARSGDRRPASRPQPQRGPAPASEKQIAFLRKLGYEGETDGLSKREASALIDELKTGGRRTGPLRSSDFVDVPRSADDAEIRAGEAAVRLAQQAGPAGSEAREAAYLAQEMADYNMGL